MRDGVFRLTQREAQVMALLGNGLSQPEIAAHLGVNIDTVRKRIHDAKEKLNVQEQADEKVV